MRRGVGKREDENLIWTGENEQLNVSTKTLCTIVPSNPKFVLSRLMTREKEAGCIIV